jgi:ketosteroid isomerase-like protein
VSQENVEFVRIYFEAWDAGGINAVADFWDPQITWRSAEGAIDDVGVIRGVEAMRAYADDWLDNFDDVHFELEEVIDAGEQVVSVQRITGRARGSGVETELRYAVVNTVRNGKLVRGREYWTRAEALEAVGLSE